MANCVYQHYLVIFANCTQWTIFLLSFNKKKKEKKKEKKKDIKDKDKDKQV